MMKYLILPILVIFLVSFANVAQTTREKSALLKENESRRLAKQCSRKSPNDFTDIWEPSAEDIKTMEKTLSKISGLRAKCCIEGLSIEDPSKWYLQYAGLVWKGRKVIYISAIGREQPTDWVLSSDGKTHKEVPNDKWKTFAIVICDGGNAWGVIYDPKTGKFSDLSVNGIG